MKGFNMSDENKDALPVGGTTEKEIIENLAKNPVLPSYLKTKLSNQAVPSLLEMAFSFREFGKLKKRLRSPLLKTGGSSNISCSLLFKIFILGMAKSNRSYSENDHFQNKKNPGTKFIKNVP